MKPLFKITFLCEDSASQGRAEALKNTLARNCADAVEIDSHFCEYARLCHPRLRRNALAHATQADMFVVAAKGTEPIPEFVQGWMNELGERRQEKMICAEFLENAGSASALTFHRFIEMWAEQHSEMLFSNLFPDGRTPDFPLPSLRMASPMQNQKALGNQ